MDWFKYLWLVIIIIVYTIWTVQAIKDAAYYIKKHGFKLGFEYALIYSNWTDSWITIHVVILIGVIVASFIYFIITL